LAGRGKKEWHRLVCERSLAAFEAWWKLMPHTSADRAIAFERACVGIWESSYLLEATNPNRLWFHQFRERNWLSLNGLLR
jgi:hypothetical protein